jgi:RNA polymerase sigma-70 factor (ECF subfamily)
MSVVGSKLRFVALETGRQTAEERTLLAAAARGDEQAFERLLEPYRAELHAHCYRMLGSAYDADDALQDAWLRAWRGLAKFEGRSSLRSWLYRIATNACLDLIAKRPKRVLPLDYGPPADPHDPPTLPVAESTWIEPYPDDALELASGAAAPEARYEQREAVELAFVAALQHLPPNQRAALILREVLGFSAKEVAAMLDTSVAAVNSALQRARKTVAERTPERSQQETMRALGDEGVREVVARYLDAWDRNDVEGVVAMLTEDASFSMPPARYWYRGTEALLEWMPKGPLAGWRWRHVPVVANGQPALGFYCWHPGEEAYLAFALNVLTLRGDRISDVVAFICRETTATDPEAYVRWPEQPIIPRKYEYFFGRFGLPERLEG